MTVIETLNLTRYYGRKCAVDRLSLQIEAGEVVGLVGPNGAGKTTLMLLLSGLLLPDAGTIRLFGSPLEGAQPELRARIGWVPQQLAFYPGLTVWENLLFFGNLYDLPETGLRERATEILSHCHLEACRDQLADTLSGGTQRRLNLALGLIHQPRLLILDEPTAGIDAQSRELILGHLSKLAATGCTVLLSSHYEEEIRRTCRRVALLEEGRLVGWKLPAADSAEGWKTEPVSTAVEPPPSATGPRRTTSWPGRLLPGLLTVAFLGLLGWFLSSPSNDPNPASNEPPRSYSKHSSDQQKLAFLKDGAIWIREIDQPEATLLAGSQGAEPGFLWSPAGQAIVFAREGKLWKARLGEGGQTAELCELPATPFRGGSWGLDGQIVFSVGSGSLYQVPADGSGSPRRVGSR